MKNINLDDYISTFYLVPFLSIPALTMLISGEFYLAPYNIAMKGFQVRLLAIMFLLFCTHVTYNVLIKWPRLNDKPGKVREVIKIFFSSGLFYIWILSFCVFYMQKFYTSILLLIVYIISLIICYFFQKKFIQKIKIIING